MMAKQSKSAKSSALARKPLTMQRTYRFNTQLFESFEEDCARHLANPKLVLEALILHWMDGDAKVRGAMALRHRQRFGNTSDEN